MVLGLLLVDEVEALGLEELKRGDAARQGVSAPAKGLIKSAAGAHLVDLGSSNPGDELLGERVVGGLAVLEELRGALSASAKRGPVGRDVAPSSGGPRTPWQQRRPK